MNQLLTDEQVEEILNKNLIELIGMDELPEEQKRELYEVMAKTVQNRAVARIYEQLTEEKRSELDQLLGNGSGDQVQAFLSDNDIDIAAITIQEALAYKLEFMEIFKTAQAQQEQADKE